MLPGVGHFFHRLQLRACLRENGRAHWAAVMESFPCADAQAARKSLTMLPGQGLFVAR
jgi:hypothetical protein